MDLADKTLKIQERIENKARSLTKGKLGRVLKMARKPDNEEFKRSSLITLVGMLFIGGLGFIIYLIWTYIPPFFSDLLNL